MILSTCVNYFLPSSCLCTPMIYRGSFFNVLYKLAQNSVFLTPYFLSSSYFHFLNATCQHLKYYIFSVLFVSLLHLLPIEKCCLQNDFYLLGSLAYSECLEHHWTCVWSTFSRNMLSECFSIKVLAPNLANGNVTLTTSFTAKHWNPLLF